MTVTVSDMCWLVPPRPDGTPQETVGQVLEALAHPEPLTQLAALGAAPLPGGGSGWRVGPELGVEAGHVVVRLPRPCPHFATMDPPAFDVPRPLPCGCWAGADGNWGYEDAAHVPVGELAERAARRQELPADSWEWLTPGG